MDLTILVMHADKPVSLLNEMANALDCICLLLNSLSLFVSEFFSGTGYLTACFALMVGSEGRAVGVEHIPELVDTSIENIKKSAAAPQLNDGALSIHVAGKHCLLRTSIEPNHVEAASIQPVQCRL